MEYLINLPDALFKQHLMRYLTIKDVAMLDNACSSNLYRHLLLDRISNGILVGDISDEESLTLDRLQWLQEKRIYLENLFIARIVEATDKDKETYRPNQLNWIRANASKTVLASLTKYCMGLRIADNFIFEAFSRTLSTSSLKCCDLQSLTIDFDLNEKDTTILYSLAHHFSALQSIEFRDCAKITDEILIPIVSSCKRLKAIKFVRKGYDYMPITDASLIAISTHCPGLQLLDTVICRNISDIGLIAISLRCFGLLHVDLGCTYTDLITDTGIISISINCRGLLTLFIPEYIKVTDNSMLSLAANCHLLQQLDVRGCDVTDTGIITISKHCTGLLHCSLANSDASKLSDTSIISLATNCKLLQSLYIYQSPGITDLSLLALAIHSRNNLEVVDFTECDNVSNACWDLLESSLNVK